MLVKDEPKIRVVIKNDKPITTSRNVAEIFDKRHDHILRDVDDLKFTIGVTQNWGDLFYETTYIHPQNKQEYREYLMTKDGFTLLAMGFTGKKAINFKMAYINQFNKMEQQIISNLPGTYKEALLKLVEQVELTENLEQQIKADKPKVLFAESVSASHTSILVGDLAKLLKQNGVDVGAHRLFKWLRENGFLIKRKGTDWNMPTQRSMDMELFEIKESTHNNPDGSVRITKTSKVTGKGQVYFINKFLQEG